VTGGWWLTCSAKNRIPFLVSTNSNVSPNNGLKLVSVVTKHNIHPLEKKQMNGYIDIEREGGRLESNRMERNGMEWNGMEWNDVGEKERLNVVYKTAQSHSIH
jgi:hypothetical protein